MNYYCEIYILFKEMFYFRREMHVQKKAYSYIYFIEDEYDVVKCAVVIKFYLIFSKCIIRPSN